VALWWKVFLFQESGIAAMDKNLTKKRKISKIMRKMENSFWEHSAYQKWHWLWKVALQALPFRQGIAAGIVALPESGIAPILESVIVPCALPESQTSGWIKI